MAFGVSIKSWRDLVQELSSIQSECEDMRHFFVKGKTFAMVSDEITVGIFEL